MVAGCGHCRIVTGAFSDSESILWICDDEEDGMEIVDVLSKGYAGSGAVCVSSVGVVCRVPFIATRYVSNWCMLGSAGGDGPEMGLE